MTARSRPPNQAQGRVTRSTAQATELPARLRHAGGRPRDERASKAIAEAALRQLTDIGYSRMSVESVAAEAGVARATVYRRYFDKADLVTAAIAGSYELPTSAGDDPLADLVRFLDEFDARFATSCLEVIGCLLGAREEPHAFSLHRRRVVGPRIGYVRELLARARQAGMLDPDVDIDLSLQLLLGAVFARRVAGIPHDPGWAQRAVDSLRQGIGTA